VRANWLTVARMVLAQVRAVVIGAVVLAACSSSPESTSDAPPASDSRVDSVVDSVSGPADASSCLGGTFGGGESSLANISATATIVDQNNAPVVGQPVFLCGLDLCSSPATTGGSGQVSISASLSEKRPAFKFGDAIAYANLMIPLTTASNAFGTVTTAKLPTAGSAMAAGASATSGDVTVTVASGGSIAIDELTYGTPDSQGLRTAAIPIAQTTALFAPVTVDGHAADFSLVYGLSPAETVMCPPATVTVALPHATASPNDLGWAPGAAVELWITTSDTGQRFGTYAGWTKVSDGHVSADGTTVSTTGEAGMALLETFAIRLK
jgi:hypothetical protein